MTALSKSTLPGLVYSLNPYVGCEHGCRYCYVPDVLRRRDLHERWGELVMPKSGIVDELRSEIKSKPKGTVGVSTVTDPYQPLEKRLELTRSCLEILLQAGFPVSIQTKSDLVLRDLDLICKGKADVGLTIITMDKYLAEKLEPNAPPPDARRQVLQELSEKGLETWLFLGPIIPGVNDGEEEIRSVLKSVRVSYVIYDRFRAKPLACERLWDLAPDLRLVKSVEWRKSVHSRMRKICAELNLKCVPAF